MANPFDQFDAPAASGGNPFDQFDEKPKAKDATLSERAGYGFKRALSATQTALTDDPTKIAKQVAETTAEAPRQSAAAAQMQADIKPYVDAANKAEGVVDTVKGYGILAAKRAGQLISNPGEAGKMIAEQLPNSLPGMAGSIAGAKGGAALGSVFGPMGTAAGAVIGGVAGGLAGGYLTEKGSSVQEQVQKKAQEAGVNIQDQGAVSELVRNNQTEIDNSAALKGLGTAGTDAVLNVLTVGLSGMGRRMLGKEIGTLAGAVKAGQVTAADAAKELAALEAKAVAQGSWKQVLGRGAAVTGAEMLGEGFSEGVGQKLAYGSVDAGEVVDESLLGLGQGVGMAAASGAYNKLAGTPDQNTNLQRIESLRNAIGTADPNAGQPPAQPPAPAAEQPPAPFVNPASLTGNNAAALLGGQGSGLTGAADPLRAAIKPSEAMGIDPNAGVLSRTAAEAVDGPASMEMAMRQAERDMAALAAEDNPEAGAAPQTPATDPLIAQVAGYVAEMGTASPQMVAAKFGVTIPRATELLAQADPTVDDLFPPPQGAANVSNADAPGSVAAGTGGPVGVDATGSGPDAGLLAAATGPSAAGDSAAPGPAVQEGDAAPVPGQQLDPALTAEQPKPKSLKEAIARKQAERANVQDQPQGTAPAAAPAPAPAVQAPQAVGSDGAAQPGAATAGRAGVEADGVGRPTDQVYVGKSALFDGFGASTGSLGEGSRRQLMVDPAGGFFWGDWNQMAQRDTGAVSTGADKDAMPASFPTGKEAREAAASTPPTKTAPAATPSPTTTEPTNAPPSPEAAQAVETAPQGREEAALLSDSVSTEPNLEAAKALLARQRAATGNAVAEGKVRKELRDLAAKTPETDAKTVLALDTAATRLGMGEGKLKGLEFMPAESSRLKRDLSGPAPAAAPAVAAPAPSQQAQAPAETQAVNAEGMSRADVLQALEDGKKVIRFGETVWIEKTMAGKVETYVVKSREADSAATFTKGPVGPGRSWGWGRGDAAREAIKSWDFPAAATPTAEPSPLVKAMNDLADVRAKIAAQGQVVDDRLLQRERQLKAMVKELEANGQNDELDAEMRSYESKATPLDMKGRNKGDMLTMGNGTQYRVVGADEAAGRIRLVRNPDMLSERNVSLGQEEYDRLVADHDQTRAEAMAQAPAPAPAPQPAAKDDALAEREKAAKAKMLNAAAKLANLLSKNTRANITPEQEQAMLPIAIELFEGAMELGYVKFKQAAKYVRQFIANAIDQDAADSLPVDTLQGAYIAVSRRHKDKAITPKAEVITVDSAEEIDAEPLDNAATQADTGAPKDGNAAQQLDRPSPSALDGTPSGDVLAPAESGDAGQGADRGGRSDSAGNPRPDDAGGDVGRGVGGDAGAVPVPAGRTRANAKDGKKPRVSRAGGAGQGLGDAGRPGGLTPESGANPAPNAPDIPAPQPSAEDFTITDELALGEGGQKTKFKNNVAAIRLMRDLEQTGRMATPDEQMVLAKYVGWGGLSQAFDPNNADWAKEHAEITALMSPEELAAAARSTRYAHYTSREIIVDGIYAAMRRFGFSGGKTLEAGAGVGNFIGLMPADMRSAGRFTAIEREPFSSAIARQLYPQQSVQRADFTEFKGTDAYFDAAVGNPPFASDPQTDRSGRKHLSGLSLHNYFFAKSIDMLREGGIMAQVVTNSFLDAKGDKARRYISDRVEFLGAIRLPNSAFSKNAGTEVTTDIIFLKKRPDSEVGGKAARADAKRWLDTGIYTDKRGKPVALNQYFIDNPDMMLGDFGAYGTMYGPDQPALVARQGQDTLAMLKAAVEKLPAGVYKSIAETGTAAQVNAAVVALKNPTVKEGGYFIEGGKLMQRLEDIAGEARAVEITADTPWTAKTNLGEAGVERIKALAEMRGTVRGLLAAEMADNSLQMTALRATLNKQYDAYRDAHGLINDPSTLRVFDDDPDFPLLASLEHGYTPGIGLAAAKRMGVKPTKSTAKKGPIFTQRVVAARQAVQKVETPADALAVSMAERGKLDAAYIGQLLGMEPDAVLNALSTGDKPLLFRDPATDEYVLRDAYLSGNVRAKLAQAREAGMFTNVTELEAVQPEDVGSHEITARLGSPWVPVEVYQDFAKALYGEDSKVSVAYLPANSSFQVLVYGASDVAMANTWGTPEYPGDALLQAVMNNRTIKVTYRDSDGKTHTDVAATEKANEKAQQIKEKFNDWLFADADRSEVLTKAYNETNNNYVTRVYDGSNMTFPGKVPDSVIKFRRHQRNAIARIVQDRTALLDHVVGAGKTFTVISGAMELKRTGLARKPMVAVPNHLVKQWAADFYRLYPGANVLTATKKDFEKPNRRKFLAKIATGDWDAVVIAHSSFGFIKPAPEYEAEFNQREIRKIMATIKTVEDGDGDKQVKKRTVKQLEGMKERLENRIRALRDKPMDDLLDFEQIGVDQLFVDEAHLFKNLMFTTKMQGVSGLNDPTGSQRAYDMYVKTNQIMEKNGRGQGVVFATGTPVSNSLAEMYHMMRYLMPNQMKELGFESFDAWANTYASVEQVWMQAPSGDGFKAQNRMSNFVNTPELLKMFDQVSDTVTMDDIKKAYAEENDGAEFPLPKLKGGRRTPVPMDKSAAQDEYMADIAKRAKAIEQRKGPPQKGDDNILVVMGDARKAAMDIRLVKPDVLEREKGGRIDLSTDAVVERYKKFDSVKGTQLVFSDLGTPLKHAKKELAEYEALQVRIQAGNEDVAISAALGNEAAMETMEDAEAAQAELDSMGADWLSAVKAALRGFSVYDDFRAALVEKGIPEAEIAFIHDYNTDDQKASLFRKVNAGQIRVLLGSTAKLGAGTNVQERLVALHHLDVPWRPSDVEQREGRIERQGNRLMTEWPDFEIEILAYVTKDTLDMRMWQVQETKLKMINQLRTRKIGREIDNAFEDMELSAGEMQAAATGDINLLKEIQLRSDVKKLEQRRRAFEGQRNDLLSRKRRNAENLRKMPGLLAQAKEEAAQVNAYRAEVVESRPPFKMNIDGKDYTDATEAQTVLRELDEATDEATDLAGEVTKKKRPLSVTIDGELIKNRSVMAELLSNAMGDASPIAWTFNGETYRRRTVIGNAIRAKVQDAIADETLQEVGTIGAYTVSVEGSTGKGDVPILEVTLSRDGEVKLSNTIGVGDTGAMPSRVITQVENLMEIAVREADYLERGLERAKKESAELSKVDDSGAWPDQPKLDAARAAHKAILDLLRTKLSPAAFANLAQTGSFEANTTDVVFSQGLLSPASVGPKPTPDQIQRLVDKVQQVAKNALPVTVTASPSDVPGLKVPAGAKLTGVLTGGRIYLFADNIRSTGEAYATLFHELFHLGLQKVIPAEDYAAMLGKFSRNLLVQRFVRDWKASPEGVEKAATMPAAAYDALAAEEALAMVSEELAANNGIGTRNMPGLAKSMLSWLSSVADRLGFPPAFSDWMRGLTRTDAEKFVSDMVRAAMGGEKNLGATRARYGTELAEMTEQTRLSAGVGEVTPPFSRGDNGRMTEDQARQQGFTLKAYRGVSKANPFNDTGTTWLTTSREVAEAYAEEVMGYDDPGVLEVMVKPDALPRFDASRLTDEQRAELAADDFGNPQAVGIYDRSDDHPLGGSRRNVTVIHAPREAVVVLGGNQADGAKFRSTPRELAGMAADQLKMTLTAPGKLSWWSKTVGTMYGLAERHPAFKPVFNAAQSFIDDVSYYATDAADMAPKMLPKLESWRDIAKSPISAEDNKAIEAPINEGTLLWARDESGRPVKVAELEAQAATMTADQKARRLLRNEKISDGVLKMWQGLPQEQYEKLIDSRYESQMLAPGVVWTDAELKAIWKLNDTQIGLYREVRAAIDKSLDNLAKSDLVRFVGKDGAGIKDAIMEAGSVDEAALMARDYFIGLAEAEPDRAEMLLATANGVMDRADKVTRLKAQGYAPLSRFGKYTVDVVTDEGRQYFGLFESMREANQMAVRMRGEFGKDAVSQGTLSDESFKLFQGITPETLELFGNMLGLSDTGDTPQDQAFQAYLKLTKNNRSAMKRLIQRKGILGYSQDVGRVLASFIHSNARQTAGALHIGDLTEAVNAIPQSQGELKDEAVRLAEYIQNPQEEAQAFRGLLFAQYLGGSIASAMVNMTQPLQVSFPYLSQFGGASVAGKELMRAIKGIATGKKDYEPDLARALKHAEEDGTVSPQEVHQLMAQARGAGTLRSGDGTRLGDTLAKGGNAWAKMSLAWGKVFGVAEQMNRRSTFIAAYRLATAQKMDDPAGFAKKAVHETQFIYSKANKMRWGRGAIGGVAMTFKSYSVSYLELLHRMATQGGPEGKRAAMLAVAVLLVMGGAGGLPFMKDAEDITDAIAQVMGYNFSTKQAKQELLQDLFGEAAGQFIERGVSGLPGVPLDVTGRLGMGNLIPGTGLFLQKNSNTRDVMELAGPAGDLVQRVMNAGGMAVRGNLGGAALELSPKALRDLAKGADMADKGMYRDAKGFKVLDTTPVEAGLKAIGFQPNTVAQVQEGNYLMQRQKDYYNATAQNIRAKWARGLFEKDEGMVAEARDAINAWNEKNPDQRMSPNMPAIWKRVREMAKDKDQRIADTAPKAMRAQFREETARVREAL